MATASEWMAHEFTLRGNVIAERMKALLEEAHGDEWNVIVKHVEKVKSYAPRVYHLVYDMRCFPFRYNQKLALIGHNPGVRLYVCGQQTPKMQSVLASIIGDQVLEGPVKAATPPFNVQAGVAMRDDCVAFNVPVFGPAIATAVMALFDGDAMERLAGGEWLVPRRVLPNGSSTQQHAYTAWTVGALFIRAN